MLILITGMPGSGKSKLAEDIAIKRSAETKYYIATMHNTSAESHLKVEKHRQMRQDKNFITLEHAIGLGQIAPQENAVYLLECLTNLVANEMFDKGGYGVDCTQPILQDLQRLSAQGTDLVIVTNEVSADGVHYDFYTNAYIKNITQLNRTIAQKADIVIESVAGIAVYLKGEFYENF